MADTITIRTSTERDVIKIVERGPQGPAGGGGGGGSGTVTSVALASSDLTIIGSPITTSGTITANLANSGATAGTYTKVTVDAKGRVTAGATATAADVGAAATTHAAEHEAGEADEIQAMAALVITVGGTNVDGVYFYDGTLTSGRPNFFRVGTRKNTKLQWNNARSKWELYRNLTLEAEEAAAGTSAKPWDAVEWEDPRTPPVISSINVTRLGLEDMTQKLAETGALATATASEDGLMSAADKTKLNNIAAGAEVNVNADWNASSGDAQILNKPTIPTASSTTPSALGTAAAGSSTDFARADHVHDMPTPNDINSTLGQDNLAADLNYLDAAVGAIAPSSATPEALGTASAGSSTEYSRANHVHPMPSAADVGAAASSHTHGNLTSDGKLGSTSGLPLVTTTAGAITTLALGSAGQVLKVNSGGTAVEFGAGFDAASPPAIGSTTAAAGTFTTLTANNGTLTASAPALTVGQTWNAIGTTFTALDVNVTNTASATASTLVRARLGSSIRFVVGARSGGGETSRVVAGEFQAGISDVDGTGTGALIGTFGIRARSDGNIGFVSGADTTVGNDVTLVRDAADTLALRRTTNPQVFRIYNTFSSTTSFERLNIRWASNECIIDAQAGGSGGTLRGIKIGSATSSLLGFYGVTPVDQPATVADPAGGGTQDAEARTAINAIIDRLQELGLIA